MLKKLEQDHQIHTRWEESTKEYKEMKNAFSKYMNLFGELLDEGSSC